VFEEIPSRAEPSSQRRAIKFFAVIFASFLAGSVIAWFRWSGHPLSISRKIASGEFVFGLVISGVFLLTAKSVTPEGNQKRLWGLLWALMLVQLIHDVLQ
jgi:hypothetical protein